MHCITSISPTQKTSSSTHQPNSQPSQSICKPNLFAIHYTRLIPALLKEEKKKKEHSIRAQRAAHTHTCARARARASYTKVKKSILIDSIQMQIPAGRNKSLSSGPIPGGINHPSRRGFRASSLLSIHSVLSLLCPRRAPYKRGKRQEEEEEESTRTRKKIKRNGLYNKAALIVKTFYGLAHSSLSLSTPFSSLCAKRRQEEGWRARAGPGRPGEREMIF